MLLIRLSTFCYGLLYETEDVYEEIIFLLFMKNKRFNAFNFTGLIFINPDKHTNIIQIHKHGTIIHL